MYIYTAYTQYIELLYNTICCCIYFPPEHVVQFGYDQTKMSQNYTEVICGEIILKQYLALELWGHPKQYK